MKESTVSIVAQTAMADVEQPQAGDDAYDLGDGPEDVANEEEEENFQAGMRRNAQDYEAHDADQDNKLDFGEFCAMVRSREEGEQLRSCAGRIRSARTTPTSSRPARLNGHHANKYVI